MTGRELARELEGPLRHHLALARRRNQWQRLRAGHARAKRDFLDDTVLAGRRRATHCKGDQEHHVNDRALTNSVQKYWWRADQSEDNGYAREC